MGANNSLRRNKAFDIPFAPATRLEANAWLLKAGYGAATKHTDIVNSTNKNIVGFAGEQDDADRLMSIGYAAWLDEQFADSSIPGAHANGTVATAQSQAGSTYTNQTLQIMHSQALRGSAQTRLKLLNALSQIFVVTGVGGSDGPYSLNRYFDILLKATASANNSSYRVLLEDVTYSYAMGFMLTYLNNNKAAPDQNYAREILQLFSVGLVQLNMDGTPILDSNGIPKETYAPSDIPELAKKFTGLMMLARDLPLGDDATIHTETAVTLFAYPDGSQTTIPAQTAKVVNPDRTPKEFTVTVTGANTFTIPVINTFRGSNWSSGCSIAYRRSNLITATKVVATISTLNNVSTATVTTPTAHGLTTGDKIYTFSNVDESLKIIHDYIFNHPNVAPFISRALIQFFVTSNPSPEYIRRVALKFVDNGNGVRGDLSAVTKAILLDREAIIPYGKNPRNFGRMSTITERYYRVGRALREDIVHYRGGEGAFGLYFGDGSLDQFQRPMFSKIETPSDWWRIASVTMSTEPFRAPSVFNFFRPGYVPAGTPLGDVNQKAPEFQLVNQETVITWDNVVSSICETKAASAAYAVTIGGMLDNRSTSVIRGWTLPSESAFVANTSTSAQGNVTTAHTTFSAPVFSRNRTTGGIAKANNVNLSAGSGLKTLNGIPTSPATTAGETIDLSPLTILPSSGMVTQRYISGGGAESILDFPTSITVLYKLANTIAADGNSATIPSDATLDLAINYMEQRLMTRPISTELRDIMRNMGKVAVGIPTPFATGNTAFMDYYGHFEMTYAQKRVRHMLAALLASPEFIYQD